MNPITNETALEFIRLLTNLGGVDMLKEPEMIILDPEGNPRCVKDGDQLKPIQIIMSGMVKDDNNFLFNPFKSVEGNNPAYIWFYTSRCNNVAVVTKRIILALVERGVVKESTNDYEHLQLIADISEACDDKMLQELEGAKLNAADILRVFYDKRIKTAEAQTLLFSDEIETQHKLRKKTWATIRKIFRTIFELGDDEMTMSGYQYRAKVMHIPEIDAKLHVLNQIIAKLEKWSHIVNVKFEPEVFSKHLENLEQYSRMFAWFTARSTKEGQTVISNQKKSEGLPLLIDRAQSDTTIKLNGELPNLQKVPTTIDPSMTPAPMTIPIGGLPPLLPPTPAPMTVSIPVANPYVCAPGLPPLQQQQSFVPDRIPCC